MRPCKHSAFGARFDSLLRKHKLNQKRAAKLFRISQSAVSFLVTGRSSEASLKTVARIHKVTGCDLHWLVTGKPQAPAVPDCIQRLNKIMSKRRAA